MPSDLVYLRWLEEMVISFDGRYVAVNVRKVDGVGMDTSLL